jgi:hypothetical protein
MASANVRIKTSKVLELLKKRVADLEALKKNSDKIQEAHRKAVKAWEDKVVKSISRTTKPDECSVNNRFYGSPKGKVKVELTYFVDEAKIGERPETPETWLYSHANLLEEIKQVINLLELTDDETVSASAYKNLAKLL